MTTTNPDVVSPQLLDLLDVHQSLFSALPNDAHRTIFNPSTWWAEMIIHPLPDGSRLCLALEVFVTEEGWREELHGQYHLIHRTGLGVVQQRIPLLAGNLDHMIDYLSESLTPWLDRTHHPAATEPALSMQRFVGQVVNQLDGFIKFPDPRLLR